MRVTLIMAIGMGAVICLAGCNGPGVALIGTPAQTVTVEGATFNVFVKGERAEAVRTNFEFGATVRSVFPRAIQAMEQVSGCNVLRESVVGDPAHIKADLNCP